MAIQGKKSDHRCFAFLMFATALMAAGCAASEDAAGPDAGADAPPAEPAHLSLAFEGPAEGAEVRVATDGAKVLCIRAQSNAALEIRRLPVEVASPEGLFLDNEAQYRRWMVTDEATGAVVNGPVDLDREASDTQAIVFSEPFALPPGDPFTFCVRTDVQNEHELDGNRLVVRLLPLVAGDVQLRDDGSDMPIEQVTQADPIQAELRIKGISGPSGPRYRPSVMLAPLPTTGFQLGDTVTYRATITAPPEADVLIKQLSFRTHVYIASGDAAVTALDNARLAPPDQASLAARSDIQVSGVGCNFAASWSMRCIIVNLTDPLFIPKNTSATVDLRQQVGGTLFNGEQLRTFAVVDITGPQEGPLTRGRIASQYPSNVIWSNDGLWWYNGYSVQWNNAFSTPQVVGYHEP